MVQVAALHYFAVGREATPQSPPNLLIQASSHQRYRFSVSTVCNKNFEKNNTYCRYRRLYL
jgi:hypothetical protein